MQPLFCCFNCQVANLSDPYSAPLVGWQANLTRPILILVLNGQSADTSDPYSAALMVSLPTHPNLILHKWLVGRSI